MRGLASVDVEQGQNRDNLTPGQPGAFFLELIERLLRLADEHPGSSSKIGSIGRCAKMLLVSVA
jgi:hypothetical protein